MSAIDTFSEYETVIGLEVHAELKTKTKIFCRCKTDFGAKPNTQICPVCMGMPGTLPVMNKKVVELAVKAGLVTHCTVAEFCKMDRKNYFYPDLPKGYQISQFDLPLCQHGYLDIDTPKGPKRIGITRIHMEEDAGKLIHAHNQTLVDCNRCGVPLIEIVSEPDMRNAQEVDAYLKKLRSYLMYADISDCKMNEGSFRCDVNLSVHKKGTPFGVRTEMKNINSFAFVTKAIEYEQQRQLQELVNGHNIVQETRRYDELTDTTVTMRVKENADDYRYFPEPDLPPIRLKKESIQQIADTLPQMPDTRQQTYIREYGLSPDDCAVILAQKQTADWFERGVRKSDYPKLYANLLISDLLGMGKNGEYLTILPDKVAIIANLLGQETVNHATAKKLLEKLLTQDFDIQTFVSEHHLEQINDEAVLRQAVEQAVRLSEQAVYAYKAGKKNALGSVVGKAMAQTKGKGNPRLVQKLVEEALCADK